MHSTSGSNKKSVPRRLGFTTVLFSLVLAILVFTGAAMAAGITGPSKGPLAQATTAATTTAPAAVGTQEAPGAVETGGVPAPIQTGEAPDAQLTANAAIPNQSNPGSNPAPGTGATDVNPGTSTSSNNSFPWLLALLVAVVVVLLIIAFVLMRTRRSTLATATTATTATTMPVPPSPAPVVTTTVPPASTVVAAPVPPTAASGAPALVSPALAAAAAAAAVTTPVVRTLTCPNCSTVNEWGENFCHECGQDLRPLRASLIAAAAPPPEIVTDDMPYLETQDRVDEQLEYVLSRKVIVVGTAPGNDIVIDSAFKGYETVSPRHAELRRDGDGNGFTVVDLGSDNGTYVNDARTGENLLAEGDKLRFGSVRFVYRVP